MHDNLTLGDPPIPAEQVHRAAALASADRFINALPRGYHTVLSDSTHGTGVHLSAGQRQLLALARALTTQPPVLLLDEATAVLDPASDAAFRTALRDHVQPAGTAVITIAHRLATARHADRIILLADGRIQEHGTPGRPSRHRHRFRRPMRPRRRRLGLATRPEHAMSNELAAARLDDRKQDPCIH